VVQVADAGGHYVELRLCQLAGRPTGTVGPQFEQILNFGQRKPHRLGALDEAQPVGIVRGAAPDASPRTGGLRDQASALVIADSFHVNARRRGQSTDGQRLVQCKM